ncbi:MAG: hypothetical protein GYB67_08010 [Chloroflexi bacterium]|nr:hypothetical protein [Chloroflexota bacterium]
MIGACLPSWGWAAISGGWRWLSIGCVSHSKTPGSRPMGRKLRRHLLIAGFFVGLACLALYWPLFHAGTHVGATQPHDYYHFHWNYWWMRHALTTGLNIYETNYVLFPATTSLALHTLTPFWYPVWALIEPLAGSLIAMHVIFVLALALSGYACYGLLRQEAVPGSLALSGGMIFMLTPAMLLSVFVTNINYLSLFWLPLALVIWGRIARSIDQPRRTFVWALVLGLTLYGMLMTEYQHGLFLAFLIVPYGLLTLITAGSGRLRGRLVGAGIVAVGLALGLLWIAGPLPHLLTYDLSSLSPQRIEDAAGIPFPDGYLWRWSPYSRSVTLGALILPSVAAALLISLSPLRRRLNKPIRWFWFAVMLPPLIFSAGPSITLGETTVTTPYVALHEIFGGLFRNPARFAPVIILPALIFVGQTLGPLMSQRTPVRLGLLAALTLLVLIDARIYEPMPLRPAAPVYGFYEMMGRERGAPYDDYAVVEVPVAGGSGEAWVGEFAPMETQFYGLTHGKRMLNGTIARAPLSHFWHWLYDDPMLAWLGQRRYLEPERVEAQLRNRIDAWPIGYIVVHQDYIGRVGPTVQEILGYFNSLPDLLCPVAVERSAVAYRTTWHPDGCPPRTPPEIAPGVHEIDIGAPGDERYIGWGWHWAETISGLTLRWMGEYPQTRLYVDLPPSDYILTIPAQAFHEPRTLRLRVNDQPLGAPVVVATAQLAEYTFELPAALIGDGVHVEIVFDYDGWRVPTEVGQGDDQRRLALAVNWLRFTRAAGE